LKILQFIETGGPGGAEKVVSLLCKQLKEEGHQVFAGTLREGWLTQELDKLEIKRLKFNTSKIFDLKLILHLIRFCKKEKIEVIHSHLLDSNFYCAIAALILKIPLIATEHGDIHHLKKKKFTSLKVKVVSILAKYISAVSEFSRNALILKGASDKKVVVIRNPISIYQKIETSREFLNLPINESDWLWAHVANLRPVKDQVTLLKGFHKSKELSKIPQKLLLIGDGDLLLELKQIVVDLNIQDDVFFLGFRDDVKKILSVCNGFILSSISEAMPMSISEAILADLIVISSSVGGIPEIILDNKTGFLFEAKNEQELAIKISKTLTFNKEELETIKSSAKNNLLANYSLEKITKEFLKYYKEN
jgi:glycosyltransferase involved in cell wall biosynthesis